MSEQSNTVCALNSGAKKEKRRERKALSERNNKYIDNDPLCLRIQCTCNHGQKSNFKCKQISQQDVVRNRKNFYSTSKKVHQDVYLCRLISAFEPQRRGKGTPRPSGKTKLRKLSTSFFLYGKKKIMKRVCKSFFMAVFSIKRQRLSTIMKCVMDGKVPKEERGGDRRSAKSHEKKEHLRNFLRNLPCSESHYNRAKSKRVYLDAALNMKKLRMFYNNSVPNDLKVKRTMFYEVFTFEFNIGFRSPASDACSSCILLSNSIKNEQISTKKQELMTKLRIHKLRANFFYKLLKKRVDDSITIRFDLQQGRQLNCVVKASPNYRFDSGEQFISLLKRGRRHPRNIEQIQEDRGLSAAKKNDVTSLLTKQFGADWENLSALEWYKQILSCSRNIAEQNEEIDDDEACICTEMDTEDIRI
ncbi:unnamed protein product [Parnassius apollo]|uniref:(apollo) hypothetical protein n=1 Tax=Parnassius apollo TaxID=110799 RepID=A0A8S3WS21_PARAO|nr:unnamed protein product [Parnassius apollo]